jgi:hypothetical protein
MTGGRGIPAFRIEKTLAIFHRAVIESNPKRRMLIRTWHSLFFVQSKKQTSCCLIKNAALIKPLWGFGKSASDGDPGEKKKKKKSWPSPKACL